MEKEEETLNGTENVINSGEYEISKSVEIYSEHNAVNNYKIENKDVNKNVKLKCKMASEENDPIIETENIKIGRPEIATDNKNVDDRNKDTNKKSDLVKEAFGKNDNIAAYIESKDNCKTKDHVDLKDNTKESKDDTGMYLIFDIYSSFFSLTLFVPT